MISTRRSAKVIIPAPEALEKKTGKVMKFALDNCHDLCNVLFLEYTVHLTMAQNDIKENTTLVDINKRQNVSDHLANERTFLAWIRTGVGIMAFGFVVVKFSLFIKQLSAILGKEVIVHQQGHSAAAGIILVALGSLTTILSYVRYNQTEKKLTSGVYQQTSLLIGMMTILIFAISLFLIYYLVEST